MINPEIVSYIRTEKEKNAPDSLIRSNLLANGWTESDISEAIASLSMPAGSVSMTPSLNIDLKEYRKKIKWTTFFTLLGIDILIIAVFEILYGISGVFGLTLSSIIGRIVVIYLVAAFAAKGASPEEKRSKAIVKGIGRVVASMAMAVMIGVGILWITCIFIISVSH